MGDGGESEVKASLSGMGAVLWKQCLFRAVVAVGIRQTKCCATETVASERLRTAVLHSANPPKAA